MPRLGPWPAIVGSPLLPEPQSAIQRARERNRTHTTFTKNYVELQGITKNSKELLGINMNC